MIDMMEERRKWKHQSTEAVEKEYRRINNKLRRETDQAKENWSSSSYSFIKEK